MYLARIIYPCLLHEHESPLCINYFVIIWIGMSKNLLALSLMLIKWFFFLCPQSWSWTAAPLTLLENWDIETKKWNPLWRNWSQGPPSFVINMVILDWYRYDNSYICILFIFFYIVLYIFVRIVFWYFIKINIFFFQFMQF